MLSPVVLSTHYAECRHSECRVSFFVKLIVIMLNVIILGVDVLNVIMLSIVGPFSHYVCVSTKWFSAKCFSTKCFSIKCFLTKCFSTKKHGAIKCPWESFNFIQDGSKKSLRYKQLFFPFVSINKLDRFVSWDIFFLFA